MKPHSSDGFTLAEVLLGGMALAVAMAAILGAYLGQVTLNEHARNLSVAVQDANRVMERLRQQNSPCVGTSNPSAAAPAGFASWDAWLNDTGATGGGGKSILPTPAANELITVTTQNAAGTGPPGANENPIRVTVAVCWRHRNRTLGECTWNNVNLVADEAVPMPADTNVIDSPAMLTTLVTCR
jgi:type II secretory pathway pseudopilin PulG